MLNWNQIETVLLDMDGTLLDLHFDTYFWLTHVPQRYAEKNDLHPNEAHKQILRQIQEQEGTLNYYCLDFWSHALDLDIPALKEEVGHKIAYRPQVEEFLQQVKSHQKRSVIVTNAHRSGLDLKLQNTGLGELVDHIFCSHDFQRPKEDPVFWQELQKLEPFENNTTLLIDDSIPVLRSAQQFGIRHLLTISQPDSQQPKRTATEFPAVDDFADITPNYLYD